MSKQDEAGLILQLYDLRREEQMRKARDWYFRHFHAQSIDEFSALMFGEHGGYLRQVVSYWDMAAALVNSGAISLELFNETNQEHLGVFAMVEPLLEQIRAAYTPIYAINLEKMIDRTPDGRAKVAAMREGLQRARATIASRQTGGN